MGRARPEWGVEIASVVWVGSKGRMRARRAYDYDSYKSIVRDTLLSMVLLMGLFRVKHVVDGVEVAVIRRWVVEESTRGGEGGV